MQKQIDDILTALDNAEDHFFDRLDPKFLRVQTKVTTRHGQLLEGWLLELVNNMPSIDAFHLPASEGSGTEIDAVIVNHETRSVLLLEVKRKAGQNSTSLAAISRKLKQFPLVVSGVVPEGYSVYASCYYFYPFGAKREHITADELAAFCGVDVHAHLVEKTEEFISRLNG